MGFCFTKSFSFCKSNHSMAHWLPWIFLYLPNDAMMESENHSIPKQGLYHCFQWLQRIALYIWAAVYSPGFSSFNFLCMEVQCINIWANLNTVHKVEYDKWNQHVGPQVLWRIYLKSQPLHLELLYIRRSYVLHLRHHETQSAMGI